MPADPRNAPPLVATAVPPAEEAPRLFNPDDESIWKKYNANFEFPLSVATSVLLHIFVAIMVAIAGVWLFNFGSGGPPELESITFAGGGGSGDGSGDPEGPEMLQDPVSMNRSEATEVEQIQFDPTVLNFDPEKKTDSLLEKAQESDQQLARGIANPNGIAGDRGDGGSGRGGGRGNGFGGGIGDGFGKGIASIRERRKDRWEIILPLNDGPQFIRKLTELQAVVLVSDGPGKYLLFDMTQKNPPGKPATLPDIIKMNRIYYTNRVSFVCQIVAQELGLANTPGLFAIFIPQELEKQMFAKEMAYRGLSDEELFRRKMITKFEIDKKGNGWEVRVREQEPQKD